MRTEISLTIILKKCIVSLCGDQALTNLPWVYAHHYRIVVTLFGSLAIKEFEVLTSDVNFKNHNFAKILLQGDFTN